MSQFSTTSPAAPPGLKLAYEAITPAEERNLIALIEAAGLSYPAYDPANRRSSASFGWKYDFGADRFAPCPPLPEGFRRIAETAAAFAGVRAEELVECLLNRYEPGAVIQPHLDKPVWEHVVGVSLGAATTMNFRKPLAGGGYDHADAVLPPRSMYLLAGPARHLFEHGLPPAEATRWSITFRSLSAEGQARRRRDEAAL